MEEMNKTWLKWTQQEEARLHELATLGHSVTYITKELGRDNEVAVKEKMRKLGIKRSEICWSAAAISREAGASLNAVYSAIERLGFRDKDPRKQLTQDETARVMGVLVGGYDCHHLDRIKEEWLA